MYKPTVLAGGPTSNTCCENLMFHEPFMGYSPVFSPWDIAQRYSSFKISLTGWWSDACFIFFPSPQVPRSLCRKTSQRDKGLTPKDFPALTQIARSKCCVRAVFGLETCCRFWEVFCRCAREKISNIQHNTTRTHIILCHGLHVYFQNMYIMLYNYI